MTIAPIPAATYSWSFSLNRTASSGGSTLVAFQNLLYEIKTGMIATGWTTRYSCSSTVAGSAGDGVDRWSTAANVIWSAAGARSWYVWNHATHGQLMFSANSATNSNGTIIFSPGSNFTGGTTTTNPSASDGITLKSAAAYINSTTNTTTRVQIMTSSVGFRMIFYRAAACVGAWAIEQLLTMSPGWTSGPIAVVSNSTNPYNATSLAGTLNLWSAKHSTTLTSVSIDILRSNATTMIADGRVTGTNQEDTNAGYPAPAFLTAYSTAGTIGKLGVIRDLKWSIGEGAFADGDTAPSATYGSTKRWCRMGGGCWFPWDGSTALATT